MKKEIRQKVWQKYNCKCAYCGCSLEYKEMQVDHIEPKYLGGKDDFSNYNPSCRQCNFYKGTFRLNSFRNNLHTIKKRIKKPFIVRLAMKYGIVQFKKWDGKFYFEKHNKEVVVGSCCSCHYSNNGSHGCNRLMGYAEPKIDKSKGVECAHNGYVHYLPFKHV